MKNKLLAEIETLLFVSGEKGIEIAQLAKMMNKDNAAIMQTVELLQVKYQENSASALNILEINNRFILTTKKKFSYLLKEYAATPQATFLSNAALETLSIIAYKQPITRAQIDEIRGVQSSGLVQKLILRNLIAGKGRMDTPGKPILYGTTDYFMDYFGLKSLAELPNINAYKEEVTNQEIDLIL
ncbi:MAG: SMC-Scp complex subunit ScpB [Streptococcaceae bacterium]|jgi:segregation and condensation protein B|nr:SMC-Scp complex subunit ScpB [Streptococcaceae bacterium]